MWHYTPAACGISKVSVSSPGNQVLLVRIPRGGSILHNGPNRAFIAVHLNRVRSAFEIAMRGGAGLFCHGTWCQFSDVVEPTTGEMGAFLF